MTNMNKTAQKLASKGRYGDSYLVHMSEQEVALLDAMAPGGLTTNPDTGLPEAFSVLNILPAIVGIGATMMGAGPLAAAALNAGTGLAVGKDPMEALAGGALSYGAGSIFDAASGAAEAAVQTGAEEAANATIQAGAEAAEQATTDAAIEAAQVGGEGAAVNFPLDFDAMNGTSTWSPQGYEAVIAKPEEAWGAATDYLTTKEGLMHGAYPAALGLAGMMSAYEEPKQIEKPAVDTSQKYHAAPFSRTFVSQEYDPEGRERRYFEYAGGGAVMGPGGGMDDAVAASIEGEQPARLSNDEFVIPADVVSALGDGSSQEGHRKLYALLKAIREEKFGNGQQPPKLKKGLADLMESYA